MAVTSIYFLPFLLVTLAFYHSAATSNLREWVLLLASVVFFPSFASSPLALAPIIGFVLFGYLLILYGSGRLAWLSIGSLLALFVILKKYTVIPEELFLPFPYVVVGLSYILFRILHLIVDSHGDPARPRISFRSYLAYVF